MSKDFRFQALIKDQHDGSLKVKPKHLDCSAGPWCRRSIPQSLLLRLWLQITMSVQDGSVHILGVLASSLDSGRKWRRVVHLYLQWREQV